MKNRIKKVIIHTAKADDTPSTDCQISMLHVQAIKRGLRETDLSPEQKIKIIEMIQEELKTIEKRREQDL